MCKKIRLGTLFSGIGAPEQGAMRVHDKVETVFACEWDKFARQSYLANYDIDPKHFHKDINDLDATPYKSKVDVIVGGSPCQDFSIAGKGAGFDGMRGSLTGQFVRVVSEVMPPIFIFENVPGITTAKFRHGLKLFQEELRGLGYHLHIDMENTKHYGVPQSRKRYWIVGFLDHDSYLNFNFAPHISLQKRLKDVLEDDIPSRYYLSEELLDGFTLHTKRHLEKGNGFKFAPTNGEGTAVCLSTKAGSRPTDNFLLRAIPKGESIKVAGRLQMKGADQLKRVYKTGGVCPTLTTMQGGNQEPKILTRIFPDVCIAASRGRNVDNPSSRTVGEEVSQRLEVNKSGTSNTLTTVQKDNYVMVPSATKVGYEKAENMDSINLSVPKSKTRRGRVGKQVAQTLDTQCNQGVLFLYGIWWWVRKLTPRECLRLQDFPDSFDIVVSNSQAYKQAGNSMSVNILEMIFRQIERSKNAEKNTNKLF